MADQLIDWKPDIIIYINTPPQTCAERINKRKRPDRDLIPLSLLNNLHNLQNDYIDCVIKMEIKVHVIDGLQPVDKILADCLELICLHTKKFCKYFIKKKFDNFLLLLLKIF